MPAQFFFLFDLLEIILNDQAGIFTVTDIFPGLGKLDFNLLIVDFFLKLFCSPAGAIIKLQPFLDGPVMGFSVVRKDTGVGNGVTGSHHAMIMTHTIRVQFTPADDGCRAFGETGGLARLFAHVTVLTADPGCPGR